MDLARNFPTMAVSRRRVRVKSALHVLSWVVVLTLLAAIALGGWWYITQPTTVAGVRATRGSVAEVVYATGFVEPTRPVEVSSRVTAPVRSVLVDERDRVVRGQALALLDSEDQREVITQLAAQRINAEQDEQRALSLFQQGWSTRSARDRAVATANSARALEAAARARLDQYTIRSGISGVILRRDVEPGDLASATKVLFELGDPNSLRITTTVDERDIPLVRTGAIAMMSSDAYPNRVFRGRIVEITPGGDPEQRAFRVRIEPDRTVSLPIGLTLEVNIMVSRHENGLLVPAGAMRDGALWVADSGRARRARVTVGIRGPERTEIKSGIADGACVITEQSDKLKEGQRVRVKGC